MTPDQDVPEPPITTRQLENIRTLSRGYIRECSDDPPLSIGEQGLALALAGAMPTNAREDFGDSPQAELAWVVACAWFLRKTTPRNPRAAAQPLYAALDDIETRSPGDWAGIHNDVERLFRESGVDFGDWEDNR
jgi:hypothetical protein